MITTKCHTTLGVSVFSLPFFFQWINTHLEIE